MDVRPAHAVRLHDSLRRPGRARRINDVERRAGIDLHRPRLRTFRREPVLHRYRDAPGRCGQLLPFDRCSDRRVEEQDFRTAVRQHRRQRFGRR
jgi:hypothetical protein